jgi:hypothetical protein
VNITTAAPAEIDFRIQELDIEGARLRSRIDTAKNSLRLAIGQKRETIPSRIQPGSGGWPTSFEVALQTARALPAGTPNADGYLRTFPGQGTVGVLLGTYDDLITESAKLGEAQARLQAEYIRRGGWSRVYLVTNSNGHVHNTTGCRNCYVTTSYFWVTELSGASDEQVVAQAGARTCLSCFDSVREDIIAGRPCLIETPQQRANREEREAVKAAKIAKGVTADGSPLKVRIGRECFEVKTERAAELRYIEWAAEAQHYSWLRVPELLAKYSASADAVLTALAWKRGTTNAALAELLAPKVTAKLKRR